MIVLYVCPDATNTTHPDTRHTRSDVEDLPIHGGVAWPPCLTVDFARGIVMVL